MMRDRSPGWEGAFNLLDLGGMPLIGGGRTEYGRVFRSGRPELLTDRGWSELSVAGVSTVIDLRNEAERRARPEDPAVDPAASSEVTIVHAPTEDPHDAEFQAVCGPWLDHPRSYADNLRLFPSGAIAVFRALAQAPAATLIHCSGGRDRTGLIAAMLLQITGVESSAISDDYADAFRTASRHVTRMAELDPELVHERPYRHDEIEARIIERTEVLRDWLNSFDAASWLTSAGLSDGELAAVRGRLLPAR